MIRFNNDYCEGAHERILKKLGEINLTQVSGYSEDQYCREASDIIKKLCNAPEAAVHFLVGGTQTNLTVIASILRPYQCVISTDLAHIAVHETGAIEATGHKVHTIAAPDGKLTPEMIKTAYTLHHTNEWHDHMPQPKMVYISDTTEIGTIYTRSELAEIYKVCRECGLYLFIDGARLGYALASEENDLDLEFIAANCDIFYIGGTKCGALFGEAVVILNDKLKEDFRYMIKQRGGMLAKGWLLGVQFVELLKDGLYFDLARHADRLAVKFQREVVAAGFKMSAESSTNQQFIILPNALYQKLCEKYILSYQEPYDENSCIVRICTDWATKEENLDQLIHDIINN